jgi:hypothetical protein
MTYSKILWSFFIYGAHTVQVGGIIFFLSALIDNIRDDLLEI